MALIICIPLLLLLFPLCLATAFRKTRGWWVTGVTTAAVGLLGVSLGGNSSGKSGDIPIIDPTALFGFLGMLLILVGVICFAIGASGRGGSRPDGSPAVPRPAPLPPAHVVHPPRT